MAKIEIVNLNKKFRDRRHTFSIENLNLTIPHGKTMVILGPSGCGKTTILRIIAGLIEPDSGQVLFNGMDMKDVPPRERRIGMLFQSYALYPHLDSKTNILSYFFFRKKTPALNAEAEARYKRTAELMGVDIDYLKDRMPMTLSGGEKQRVALGRCITRDPQLFLLDEPFSNLDQKLRERYRVNLKTLLDQFSITTVYVTHDQHEALILADLIAVMDMGRIVQVGTYQDIYLRPTNLFVAEFLNPDTHTPPINVIEGRHVKNERSDVQIGVRPEDIRVSIEPTDNGIPATVKDKVNLPVMNSTILTLRVGDQSVVATVPIATRVSLNDSVWLELIKYHVFDAKTGRRIRTHPE
jgi:ABC-type sugar transport system ATPase subunit